MKTRNEEIEEQLMKNYERLNLTFSLESEPLLEWLIKERVALELEKHDLERK